jgi:tRNA G18 (ribose-2'-O)-methylase SpoU
VAGTCDALLHIPGGGRTGSLNVAAATAILVFEVIRQRA